MIVTFKLFFCMLQIFYISALYCKCLCFHHKQLFRKVFERKADKCCSILKSHLRNSKAHRVITLEMTKILKEKGFNDVSPGQKLCRQFVTKYEKLTKPPENENMTEIIKTESSQD